MDIDSIADLHSPAGSLVSIYLAQGPALSARLTDVLKPIKEKADQSNRDCQLSVRSDTERLSGIVGRLSTDPAAGFAIFASHADGLFEVLPLAVAVQDSAHLSSSPYLRPLRLLPPSLHAVALVVEQRSNTRMYELIDDELLGPEMFEADTGKRNFGGFKGFDEHRVQRHADEETAHMLRAAADRALARHQVARFDFVALFGHQTGVEAITPHLHAYLAQLERIAFVVDPHTLTEADLLSHLRRAAAEVLRKHDETVANDLLEAKHRGSPVAMGTPGVLEAVNLRAVDHLVISGPVSKAGVECASCGWLARFGASCQACGGAVTEVADVLGPAVEQVLRSGGHATQVKVASALDAVEVGAFLRFAV